LAVPESETQDVFREIVETSGMAVFRFDRYGTRVFVNDAAMSLTGKRREELIGGRFGDVLVPEDFGLAIAPAPSFGRGQEHGCT